MSDRETLQTPSPSPHESESAENASSMNGQSPSPQHAPAQSPQHASSINDQSQSLQHTPAQSPQHASARNDQSPSPQEYDEDDDFFVVQAIIDHVRVGRGLKIRIHWAGWDNDEDKTWVLESVFRESAGSDVLELLDAYKRNHNL